MKVEQSGDLWMVRDKSGQVLETFKTNGQAWHWLEKHETRPIWVKGRRENRKAIDRYRD